MDYFNENTMFKVYDSLRAAGLEEQQARDCITDMQKKGILFREQRPRSETPGFNIRSVVE